MKILESKDDYGGVAVRNHHRGFPGALHAFQKA
jgi:hypothetical protein